MTLFFELFVHLKPSQPHTGYTNNYRCDRTRRVLYYTANFVQAPRHCQGTMATGYHRSLFNYMYINFQLCRFEPIDSVRGQL